MPFLQHIPDFLPGLTIVVDILIVAFLIYELINMVRGTRAAHILLGILTIVVIYNASIWLGLNLLHSTLAVIMPFMPLAVVVLFQSEIRRTLARIGRKRLLFGRAFRRRESTEEILLALNRLSQEKTGALIVLERDIGLRTFIESGVRLDAHISRDLLLSVFQKDTALHDGAAIVQKDRLSAAACFLPLSMNPAISSKLGTRHRAAIGITEETDCLAIVVSEETGRISIAAFGEIEPDLGIEQVAERIVHHFSADRREWRNTREEAELRVPNESVQIQKVSRP
ncbi:MAG: TIGR00159 family protein [Acidobacteria bacterium]|nr:TIGR00159 family protein [Acidobacteriota bacterium]MBI3470898.1 TIGR00159 family protein [Candidatus Solibacter usitatus]